MYPRPEFYCYYTADYVACNLRCETCTRKGGDRCGNDLSVSVSEVRSVPAGQVVPRVHRVPRPVCRAVRVQHAGV